MKRLDLDFAATERWALPRAALDRVVVVVLALLVAIGALALAWQLVRLDAELAASAAAIESAQARIAAQRPPPPPALSAAQVRALNAAIAELNTPWPALLDGFARAANEEIALLQIEPDLKRGVVKALAETTQSEKMLAYLARFGSVAPFSGAMLTRHEVNANDPSRPLRFAFEVVVGDGALAAASEQGADPGGRER